MALIETVPIELLQRICEHLDEVQPFALASKRCFSAAAPTLYAHINIFYSTNSQLCTDVDRWISLLKRFASFQHVRHLDLKPEPNGALYCDMWDPEDEGLGKRWQWLGLTNKFVEGDEQDRIWQPVAELIYLLPGLTAVYYSCRPQMAACLLKAIESRADCQLHLGNFNVRSLHHDDLEYPTDLEPYEHSLFTSPNVRSMTMYGCEQYDHDDLLSHMMQAALAMASGFAPNLNTVRLFYPEGTFLSGEHFDVSVSQREWQDVEFGKLSHSSKGSLHFLELAGKLICSVPGLERWARATDFSKLKTLKIWSHVGTKILKWLINTDLDSLRTLVLDIDASDFDSDDDQIREKSEIQNLLITFLKNNTSITTLKILGDCYPKTLAKALEYHGTNLRHLSVYLTKHTENCVDYQIRAIDRRWKCASLRVLSVPVVRSNGDQTEVRKYEWIGQNFPQLRQLNLFVDCCKFGPSLAREDRFSERPVNTRFIDFNSHRQYMLLKDEDDTSDEDMWRNESNAGSKIYGLRYLLRNYAIDSELAKAIFRKVSRSKPPQSPAFERLKIRVRRDQKLNLGNASDIERICKEVIGQDWLCELDQSDHQREHILTKQILSPPQNFAGLSTRQRTSWDPSAIDIFHTEWPRQKDKSWMDCWSSRPLAGEPR